MSPNLIVKPQTEEMRGEEQQRQDEIDASVGIEGEQQVEGGSAADADGGTSAPDPEKRTVVQMSPQDEKRAAIAARFRRTEEEVPFDGDMTNPANLYGVVAQETLEPDPDAPEPGVPADPVVPAAKTATRPLTIRGQIVQMTDDEILAAAQKTLAADSYLEDARKLLEEAKTIKADRAAGRDPQHPEGQSSTQDDGQDIDPATGQPRHPGDGMEAIVEQIQFGDPKEAAKLLRTAIKAEAKTEANEGHLTRLVNNDLAKAKSALKTFSDANPAIALDEDASMLMENRIYKVYREEIAALGIDEAQIPKDPKSLADWHRFYRINGHAVSNIPDVLEKAKAHVVSKLGLTAQPVVQAAKQKGAANVQVNVNRTERRAAIPNSPTRAVAPRRDAAVAAAKTTASDVIANMRRARGQPVSG
jgi:hypothetical protein